MTFELSYPRIVKARKPEGHQPAAPRYSLRWERPVGTLVSDYFGIQGETLAWPETRAFFDLTLATFAHPDGPDAHEIMHCVDEAGVANAIVVAYWVDPSRHARWCLLSAWRPWFESPDRLAGKHGYWRETIAVPYDRHETIYSAPGYRIGFGRTPGSVVVPITTNGYFGAARDRLPISAIDALNSPYGTTVPDAVFGATHGKHLRVTVPHNLVILRSGQYWEGAGEAQRDDYQHALEPKLHRGMEYLASHKAKTGCLSMRIMSNLDSDGKERAETSVNAIFLSLEQLEAWAASHQTHLDIYAHAIAMNRKFKEKREVVTWHELFVLPGQTCFEYVNCHPGTSLLPYFEHTMGVSR